MLKHYIDQFKSIYNGEPWYGDSLLDKLESLSPEQAFVVTVPGIHCIAQVVAHMLAWRQVLSERLKGHNTSPSGLSSDEDWNTLQKLKAKGWEQLLQELDRNQHEMLQLLAAQPETWLDQPFRDDHTYRYLLEGIIHHDAYHIGQIGLLMAIQKKGA